MKNGFKIISFSRDIRPGVYFLHSSFSKAENYFRGRNIVSLVLPGVSDGPGNIVVSRLSGAKEIKISNGCIYLDGRPHKLSDKSYDPAVNFLLKIEGEKFDESRRNLLKYAPPLSMAFIFDGRREAFFSAPFLKNMLSAMKNGINLLKKGKISRGAAALSGLGHGLTPSGDDFLAGLILGLKISGRNKKAERVFTGCKTENLISIKGLKSSRKGFCTAKFKSFLFALKLGKPHLKKFKDAVEFGSTSGSDFMAGFLFSSCLY